jgi:hypothetical protein
MKLIRIELHVQIGSIIHSGINVQPLQRTLNKEVTILVKVNKLMVTQQYVHI